MGYMPINFYIPTNYFIKHSFRIFFFYDIDNSEILFFHSELITQKFYLYSSFRVSNLEILSFLFF